MTVSVAIITELVKQKVGIRTSLRDELIEAIVKSVISEFEETKGLTLDETNVQHLMLVVDFAAWRYQHPAEVESMPRHLLYRLRELHLQAMIGG